MLEEVAHTGLGGDRIHPETLTLSDLKQQLQTVLSLGKYRDVVGEGGHLSIWGSHKNTSGSWERKKVVLILVFKYRNIVLT